MREIVKNSAFEPWSYILKSHDAWDIWETKTNAMGNTNTNPIINASRSIDHIYMVSKTQARYHHQTQPFRVLINSR